MMASSNEDDPFLQVQQDVLSQIATTRPLFASYLRIRSLSTSPSSPELASARADLETALTSLSDDLEDLVEAVKAVESNPAQFGLSQHEVTRRKRLVQDIGGEIDDMQEEMRKAITGKGKGKDGDLPDPSSFAIGDGDGGEEDEDDDAYQQYERQQQVETMREQDVQLDGVAQTVGNLRRQADDMGRELEEQMEMLEEVDTVAERVGSKLQTGMSRLNRLVRQNEDRWSSCFIGVLVFVLIMLLVILLIV